MSHTFLHLSIASPCNCSGVLPSWALASGSGKDKNHCSKSTDQNLSYFFLTAASRYWTTNVLKKSLWGSVVHLTGTIDWNTKSGLCWMCLEGCVHKNFRLYLVFKLTANQKPFTCYNFCPITCGQWRGVVQSHKNLSNFSFPQQFPTFKMLQQLSTEMQSSISDNSISLLEFSELSISCKFHPNICLESKTDLSYTQLSHLHWIVSHSFYINCYTHPPPLKSSSLCGCPTHIWHW